jgi:hypothetical protein
MPYAITLPSSEYTFECAAVPGVGTLDANETRDIKITFTLLYTTTVSRYVRVAFNSNDKNSGIGTCCSARVCHRCAITLCSQSTRCFCQSFAKAKCHR